MQALDNTANGRLAHAHRVKIFEKLNKIIFGTNCHFTTIGKIENNKLFSFLIKRPLENFHETFRLSLFNIHNLVSTKTTTFDPLTGVHFNDVVLDV